MMLPYDDNQYYDIAYKHTDLSLSTEYRFALVRSRVALLIRKCPISLFYYLFLARALIFEVTVYCRRSPLVPFSLPYLQKKHAI